MVEEKKVPAYEVTVKGQYYASSGRDRFLKTYGPEKFLLPEVVEIVTGRKEVKKKVEGQQVKRFEIVKSRLNALRCAQHVIQRQLLPDRLSEKHPACVSFRTCSIVASVRVMVNPSELSIFSTNAKSVDEMSLSELSQYCRIHALSVPVSSFKDVKDARRAVMEADSETSETRVRPEEPGGIQEKAGEVSSADEVPVDQEDPAESMI